MHPTAIAERLRVRALAVDPDALCAMLLAVALLVFPEIGDAYDEHTAAINVLLGIAFGGRYALRATAITATGRALAAQAAEPAQVDATLTVNPETASGPPPPPAPTRLPGETIL